MIRQVARNFARRSVSIAAVHHAVTYTGIQQARATELLAAWIAAATEILPACLPTDIDPQLADHALALARNHPPIGDRRRA